MNLFGDRCKAQFSVAPMLLPISLLVTAHSASKVTSYGSEYRGRSYCGTQKLIYELIVKAFARAFGFCLMDALLI
jgi:hypothetical protein